MVRTTSTEFVTTDTVAQRSPYVGRFAPSPTGPLHFGSTVAAIASFLCARAAGGRWLLRIEDLDPPREQAGAADAIIAALDALGMHWDGEIVYQSTRLDAYQAALERLQQLGHTFPCACTRREIGGLPYSGRCREGIPPGREARSVRFRVPEQAIRFVDQIYGEYRQNLATDVGDFNLLRADGLFSYHLAVVVDDEAQGITDVVRGVDLLDSTPRQLALQAALGYAHPNYCHIPVVRDASGNKLSKQTGAQPVDTRQAASIWRGALTFLQQDPPDELQQAPLAGIIEWAIAHWSRETLSVVTA